jgi:hypothetical protein
MNPPPRLHLRKDNLHDIPLLFIKTNKLFYGTINDPHMPHPRSFEDINLGSWKVAAVDTNTDIEADLPRKRKHDLLFYIIMALLAIFILVILVITVRFITGSGSTYQGWGRMMYLGIE